MPILYYDNTRVSTYRDCGRKFYFRHHLDLIRDGERIELIFGQAWHESMNIIWPGIAAGRPDAEVIKEAWGIFVKLWMEKELPAPTAENYQVIVDKYPVKNPYVALEMLENYVKERKSFIRDCTNIECEKPFAVPLGMTIEVPAQGDAGMIAGVRGPTEEEVFYIGRLDKVVSHRQHGRLVIEHKTTGWYAKEGGFRSDYLESFSPNSQVDGYLFAGNSLYENGIKGLFVDAALTHKTVHDKFKFIPISRQFAALDAWLTETRVWVKRIVEDTYGLPTQDPSLPFSVFPRNTGSCHQFSGCTYRDLCKYIADPRTVGVPSGFRVEKWEPFDILKVGEIMQRRGD